MKQFISLFILAAIFSFTAGTEWKKLTQSNYDISYPGDWTLDKSGKMGTKFILSAGSDAANDRFGENVNLLIQDLKGKNITLDQFVSLSEGQIKTLIKKSRMIESTRVKEGDNEYHKMIYSGEQSNFDLQFEQYVWLIKEKAYILTLTTEQSKFDSYRETGEKILNSFTFSK